MIRLVKVLVDNLIPIMINFKPMTSHPFVQLSFGLTNIHQSTNCTLDTGDDISGFTIKVFCTGTLIKVSVIRMLHVLHFFVEQG